LGFFKISIGLDLIEDWNLLSQLRGEPLYLHLLPLTTTIAEKRTRFAFYLLSF
jgi:hypothetical protein